MSSSVSVDKDVPMEMRDGTILRADIYRPDDGQKHPAILTRFMYKIFGFMYNLDIIKATNAGYALISQVCRGKGTSGGQWAGSYVSNIEGQDGYDSVEWIANQSWCDGNVGMTGYSHGGGFTWMAAMENPPHLKAIAPWSSGTGGGQKSAAPPMSGGVVQLMNSLNWMTNEAPDVIDRLEKEGKDVTEMRQFVDWAISNPEEYINFLPLKDMPFSRFEHIGQMWNLRLHPVTRPDADEEKTYERVKVPCSHLTGWYDGGAWGPVESFKNMKELGGSKLARENQYLIVGPWAHGKWLLNYLAGINFGAETGGERGMPLVSDYLIAFFDKYLNGKNIVIPAVKYFIMGENQWHEADTWPLPQTQWQRFYLHSKGNANTSGGDGLLNRYEPGSEVTDKFIYDPLNPVPTTGGPITSTIAGFGFVAGPLEQSTLERRPDVLCYTTTELNEDTEITGGPLELHIFAATSARDTDFTAKLIDVHSDGRSHNVADGITRASGRKSEARPELVNPGEVYEYKIGMGNTSQLFRKGHRIRIDISSSNFPLFDRNMNTGNPIGEDTKGTPANQTIYHNSIYPSYIDLPVIPRLLRW